VSQLQHPGAGGRLPQLRRAAAVRPAAAADPDHNARKAASFEARIRGQLLKLDTEQARRGKLQTFREMLKRRMNTFDSIAGMEPEAMRGLLDRLEREFGGQELAPPPAAGQDAPVTPPQDEAACTGRGSPLPHRTGGARIRSALRRPSGASRRKDLRISYVHPDKLVNEVVVTSYRGCDNLWFNMPGAVVCCDHCGRCVPQALGQLQGAPRQSQFSQFQFFCTECLGL